MTEVVSEIRIVAYGTTRDECINAMDRIGRTMLDEAGGAPWLMPDDDVRKVIANQVVPSMADDQGFCYVGVRSYAFKGPVVGMFGQPMHDGFKLQRGLDD